MYIWKKGRGKYMMPKRGFVDSGMVRSPPWLIDDSSRGLSLDYRRRKGGR